MRSLALALTVVLFGWTPVVADEPRSAFVVTIGTHGRLASATAPARRRGPWIEVASNTEGFRELWMQYVPDGPDEAVAKIDFESEVAVFLLLGPQQTGGYAIEPIEVIVNARVLRVRGRLVQPMSPEDITTQAISAPYAVVRAHALALDRVEWIDADGRLLATRVIE